MNANITSGRYIRIKHIEEEYGEEFMKKLIEHFSSQPDFYGIKFIPKKETLINLKYVERLKEWWRGKNM